MRSLKTSRALTTHLRDESMATHKDANSTNRPAEGALTAFLLDDRRVWIDGIYTAGAFRSRWGHYDWSRIRAWLPHPNASVAALPMIKAHPSAPAWRGSCRFEPPTIAERTGFDVASHL